VIFSNSSNEGVLYGDNILTRALIELSQNFTAWILFILVIYNNFFKNKLYLFWIFILVEFSFIIYNLHDIANFHIRYAENVDDLNIVIKNILLVGVKFIIRSDWLWGIKNMGLDNENLGNLIYTEFNLTDSILRYFSIIQFPFRYYLNIQFWEPWEIGKFLSEMLRGFGSYNLDASSWFYFAIANSSEGFLFFILFIFIIFFGIHIIKSNYLPLFNKINLNLYFKLIFMSVGMSLSYIDRDLKIIFLSSLIFPFLIIFKNGQSK
jgi:hypothetical protein